MENAFMRSLHASHPQPRQRDMLEPYGALIGSWRFDWVGRRVDESTWTVPGEWHFAWVLEGRAIQDTWICPRRALRSTGRFPQGEYGTTLRYYDEKAKKIKVIWIGPTLSLLCVFEAEVEGGQIVQREVLAGGKDKLSRWIFKDLTAETFKWEAWVSFDKGSSWKLEQEVFARRFSLDGLPR